MSPHLGHHVRLSHVVFALLIVTISLSQCLGQSALINSPPGSSDISSIIMQTNFGRNGGYGSSGYLGGYSVQKPIVVYGGGIVPRSNNQWAGNLQTSGIANPPYIPHAPISNFESLNNLNKLLEERRNILSQYLTLFDLAKSDFYLPENSSTKKNDNQKAVTQQITSGFLFLPLESNQQQNQQNLDVVQAQISPSPPAEPTVYSPLVKKDQPQHLSQTDNNKIMSSEQVSELQSNLLTLQKNMQQTHTDQLFNRFTNEFNDHGLSSPQKNAIASQQTVQSTFTHDPYNPVLTPAPKPLYQSSSSQNYDTMVSSLRDSINNRFNNLFKP